MSERFDSQLHKNLKEIFGYDDFKGNQEAIIKNIMQGKNTFVIMPTGGGKSLCYQLPAIMQEGMAIIISPLIALMKDQVDQLRSRGIKASLLNSTLSQKIVNETKQEVLSGDTKLLYVAPETLNKEDNLAFLKQTKVSFIAVDEAHCISDWGHDFRPEYRNIKHVANQQLGHVPIIALTATATPRVKLDIINNLDIRDATVFQSSFNRPNLYYEVRFKEEQADKQLIKIIKEQPQIMGIVYCQSRKQVDELAALLNLNGIQAAPYHAGLDTNIRIKNQEAFLNKEYHVIVATIAFGMGIDTPDVRFVIHYDMPKSLEAYYQETGRAGRDDLPSICLMLYNPEDFVRLERLNKTKSNGDREKGKILLEEMRGYVISGICRRKQLLYYFGETFGDHCNYCDNCKNPRESYPAKEYLYTVLDTVQQTGQRFHLDHIIQVIQGIHTPHIESHLHQQLSVFGKGSKQNETFWRSVVRQALIHEYLAKDITDNEILQLTKKGQDFLKKKYEINFVKDNVYEPIESNKKTMTTNKGYDENLYHLLKKLREKEAKEKGIPAYTVLQDSSLEELALVYPTTLEELAQIGGLSKSKADKFGTPFIEAIKKYVEDNDIITSSDIVVKSKASRSKDKVYIIQQIDRKTDLEEIAMAKSQSMEELIDEIEAICYSGVKLNLNYYIDNILTKEEQQEIYDYFMQAKEDNIKQAYKVLGQYYNEEDIRLMRIKFLSEVAN
ncbi:MAG: ATP-dependent DNA helicase RecQ [Candidatus Amoebophilus sp. 36-38]|nr:MAG: ATP-dependent DNA helicase RecQ [Candidatus Amoebophilus sp. 36-38]